MKSRRAILCALAVAPVAYGQGSLTPPGAPAPTMKTLDQVEPRTPISSAPYVITNAGSYYLTTNLTSTGHGVVIQASRVTLDLNGFSITGDRGTGDYGVYAAGAADHVLDAVVARNGSISGFGYGVRWAYVRNGRLEHLSATSNFYYGIYLDGDSGGPCNGHLVHHCLVSHNGSDGIRLSGSVGQCSGSLVTDCTSARNSGSGIALVGEYGECSDHRIVQCTVVSNGTHGISLEGQNGDCSGNAIVRCTAAGNGGDGIRLNGTDGKCDGNRVADCTVHRNGGVGIHCVPASANRLENNHVSYNGAQGLRTAPGSSNNLIVRNTCVGQSTNYVTAVGDTYGPVITNVGPLSTSGAAAHPWANFSR